MTLKVSNVTLSVRGKTLFDSVSFEVASGEVVAIMGASGCGKSSLLSFIAGTIDRSFRCSGTVLLDGIDISQQPAFKRGIGLQFQDHLLFPHMTVGENLAFGLPAKYSRGDRGQMVEQALSDSELAGYASSNPANLSGGQKARISLMRTLLSEPSALLLDEPFSKLDPALKASFRSFVFQQVTSRAIPVVIVTHDSEDASHASRVFSL